MAYKMVYVSHNKIHSPRLCIFITFVCKDKDCIRVFIIFMFKNFQFICYKVYVGDGWFTLFQWFSNAIFLTSKIDNITAHGFYCLCWIKFSLRILLQKDLKPASRESIWNDESLRQFFCSCNCHIEILIQLTSKHEYRLFYLK